MEISKGIDIDDLIGKERTYPEYEEHNKNNTKCICVDCNFTRGYEVRGRQIKERLLELIK